MSCWSIQLLHRTEGSTVLCYICESQVTYRDHALNVTVNSLKIIPLSVNSDSGTPNIGTTSSASSLVILRAFLSGMVKTSGHLVNSFLCLSWAILWRWVLQFETAFVPVWETRKVGYDVVFLSLMHRGDSSCKLHGVYIHMYAPTSSCMKMHCRSAVQRGAHHRLLHKSSSGLPL